MRKALYGIAAIASTLALTPSLASAATITPNTAIDEVGGAACSLREAVRSAVANLDSDGCNTGSEVVGAYSVIGADEIVLTGGPHNLMVPTTNEDMNVDGDIDVSGAGGPIVIRSNVPGVNRDISQGPIIDRMFELTTGSADLTFRSITLGTAADIPLETGGIVDAEVAGNDLTLEDVEINAGGDVNATRGGAIYSTGAGSTVSISDSVIVDGDASERGGAVAMDVGAGPLTITRSRLESNSVVADTALPVTQGGAIHSENAPVTITDSEIVDNFVDDPDVAGVDVRGGGISTFGGLTMRRSLVSDNEVTSNGPAAGASESGGGIFLGNGGATDVDIVNSTIHGNIAGTVGTDDSAGGGLYNDSNGAATIDLTHVTFLANNASTTADAGDHIHNDSGATITYAASIIPGGGGINICEGGNFASGGFNALSGDDAGNCVADGPGDTATGLVGVVGGGPQDNGGLTRTIALDSTGTALDRVPVANCGGAEGTDQRSYPRSFNGTACDSGAYERIVCPNGALLNGPGAFPGCPPPATPQTPTAAPTTPVAKKCKKKKRKKRAAAAAKCKKKKKKRR